MELYITDLHQSVLIKLKTNCLLVLRIALLVGFLTIKTNVFNYKTS